MLRIALFVLVIVTLATAQVNCGLPAADPTPYKELSDGFMAALLGSVNCGLGTDNQTPATVSSYNSTSGTRTFGMTTAPKDFVTCQTNIKQYMAQWGYSYTATIAEGASSGTLSYGGDEMTIFPILRPLLFPLTSRLGPGVGIKNYATSANFQDAVRSEPRIAIYYLDKAPNSTLDVANLFTKFFCERNVTMSVDYYGLDTASPQLYCYEVLPDRNECALGIANCDKCIDGTRPAYGYTCERPDGSNMTVDATGQSIYSIVSTVYSRNYGPMYNVTKISDVVRTPSPHVTYYYAATKALTATELQNFTTLVEPAIETQYGWNSARLVITQNAKNEFVVDTLPPRTEVITCHATKVGELEYLNFFLQKETGKGSPEVLVNDDERNGNVEFTFTEDPMSVSDPSYLPTTCLFSASLANTTKQQEILNTSGYALDYSTCTVVTDCLPVPPQMAPAPAPAPAATPVDTPVDTPVFVPVTPTPRQPPTPSTPVTTPVDNPTPTEPMIPQPADNMQPQGNSNNDNNLQNDEEANRQGLIIGLSIAGAIILIALIAGIVYLVHKKRNEMRVGDNL